jgi:hypothetical protein
MRRRKTTKIQWDVLFRYRGVTLECPTPPALNLAPRARPLKTSQSEHHQLIAPQRSQRCVVVDATVVTQFVLFNPLRSFSTISSTAADTPSRKVQRYHERRLLCLPPNFDGKCTQHFLYGTLKFFNRTGTLGGCQY